MPDCSGFVNNTRHPTSSLDGETEPTIRLARVPNEDRFAPLSSTPKVSVIIASNRTELPFLDEAVASVRAQTHAVHEIILVDDGSIGDHLRQAGNRLALRYFRQPPHGVSIAFNRGIAAAEGDLISVLADDDVWHPDRVRHQLEALRDAPQAVASFSGGWFLDAQGNRFGSTWPGATSPRADMISGKVNLPVISTLLVRKDALLAAGGFHPSFLRGEDDELMLRLLQLGDFVGVDRPLFGYRRHADNVTTSPLPGRTASFQLLRLQLWGAQARGDRELEKLLRMNMRRMGRNAGRATAHELLATVRRGQWATAAAAFGWGILYRRWRFVEDVLTELVARLSRRIRSAVSRGRTPQHRTSVSD